MVIYIHGQSGRMGLALTRLAGEQQLTLCDSPEAADVIIDFTSPQGFEVVLEQAIQFSKPLVSGTTGLAKQHEQLCEVASQKIPLLCSANMSIGVNLLYALAARAGEFLVDKADCEIMETHHQYKKDAPSGTALELGRRIAEAQNKDFEQVARLSREGMDTQRQAGEIGFSAMRCGDVVGEHTAMFAMAGERLELTHRATDRGVFARGALHAAVWLAAQPAGLYVFGDTLN